MGEEPANGSSYSRLRARLNARFPSEPLARQAAAEIEHAGMTCTPPVWEECTPSRPWLVQVTCPRDLSDGLDPVEQARVLIERTVVLHSGVVVHDVPEHVVVPGVSHSQRPGGAPFVGQLPKQVIDRYERELRDQSSTDDVPLPGMTLRRAEPLRAVLYIAPFPVTGPVADDAIERCRGRAEERGWTVVGVHFDTYDGAAWRRMRADLDAGVADAVIVLSPRTVDSVPAELLVGLSDDFGVAVSVVYTNSR